VELTPQQEEDEEFLLKTLSKRGIGKRLVTWPLCPIISLKCVVICCRFSCLYLLYPIARIVDIRFRYLTEVILPELHGNGEIEQIARRGTLPENRRWRRTSDFIPEVMLEEDLKLARRRPDVKVGLLDQLRTMMSAGSAVRVEDVSEGDRGRSSELREVTTSTSSGYSNLLKTLASMLEDDRRRSQVPGHQSDDSTVASDSR
jgi:hypothetical protein